MTEKTPPTAQAQAAAVFKRIEEYFNGSRSADGRIEDPLFLGEVGLLTAQKIFLEREGLLETRGTNKYIHVAELQSLAQGTRPSRLDAGAGEKSVG